MFNVKMAVLSHIILAQWHSDAAKNIEVFDEGFKLSFKRKYESSGHYRQKDDSILKALQLIDSNPLDGIRYYVERKEDQNGHMSNVVYFIVEEDDKKYQISFHNFRRLIREGWADEKKGTMIHWDHKNSRSTAYYLARRYFAK